jgi:CRISPR-associated protein Cmr1
MSMQRVSFECEVITPMFLGGAEQQPELRAPSIKGAMRWWFRATDPEGKKNEARIFGNTDNRSLFRIKCMGLSIKTAASSSIFSSARMGTSYMGYGLRENNRGHIKTNSTFCLDLEFFPNCDRDSRQSVLRALWAMLMLGGLGGRSRRGLGSIGVIEVSGDTGDLLWQFNTIDDYARALTKFLMDVSKEGTLPNYSCWSDNAKCVVVPTSCKTGNDALEFIGNIFKDFRSYKSPGGIGKIDHDLVLDYIKKGTISHPPSRVKFGLPHNYYFTKSIGAKAEVNVPVDGTKGRRASPLIFHVQSLGDGSFCVSVVFLPAKFLPDSAKANMTGSFAPEFRIGEVLDSKGFKEVVNKNNLVSNTAASIKEIVKELNGQIKEAKNKKWDKRNEIERLFPDHVLFKKSGKKVASLSLELDNDFSVVDNFLTFLIQKKNGRSIKQ